MNKIKPTSIAEQTLEHYRDDTATPEISSVVFLKKDCLEAMEDYAKRQAILFARWKEKLTPAQRCTVWPPAGSGSGTGLYQKTDEDLYSEYLELHP